MLKLKCSATPGIIERWSKPPTLPLLACHGSDHLYSPGRQLAKCTYCSSNVLTQHSLLPKTSFVLQGCIKVVLSYGKKYHVVKSL